ncbi:MAG: hypothetical protein QXP42_05920 [Candidatus Micrarchaeia archaeon]
MKCKICGKKLQDSTCMFYMGQAFCPSCYARMSGMQKCSRCGRLYDMRLMFTIAKKHICRNCALKASDDNKINEKPQLPKKIRCPRCNRFLDPSSFHHAVCDDCFSKRNKHSEKKEKAEESPISYPPPHFAVNKQPEAQIATYCKKCGHKNVGKKKCERCGSEI